MKTKWLLTTLAALFLFVTACGDVVDQDDYSKGKADNSNSMSSVVAKPLASTFDIDESSWLPFLSYWDKKSGKGNVNGTFFLAFKENTPYLQIPIVFKGVNRITPDYYAKVVQPIQQAFVDKGSSLERFMDGTDYLPSEEEFSLSFVDSYAGKLKTNLENLFNNMGIPAEVIIQYEDIELSSFENKLLNGGSLSNSDTQDVDTLKRIVWDILRMGDNQNYRREDYLTFLLFPFPDIFQPYAETQNYNPPIGQPIPTIIHEICHYMFMDTYEGYYNEFSPPNAVMADLTSNQYTLKRGETIAFSWWEQFLVFKNIYRTASNNSEKVKESDIASAKESLKSLQDKIAVWMNRARAGYLSDNGTFTGKNGQDLTLEKSEWPALFENADITAPVLLVIDDQGVIVHINAKHKNEQVGYVRFMGDVFGLTNLYIESRIQTMLGE